jgi:hypothetical protein
MSRKIRQDKRKLTTIKFSPPLLPSLLNCVDGNTNSKRKHELLLLPFPFPPASSPVLPFPRSQPMLPPSISVSTCTQTTSHLYPAPSAAPAHLCARSLSRFVRAALFASSAISFSSLQFLAYMQCSTRFQKKRPIPVYDRKLHFLSRRRRKLLKRARRPGPRRGIVHLRANGHSYSHSSHRVLVRPHSTILL